MNIVTVLGTRPEIIRLSLIIKKLDQLAAKHTVIHTGQNFTYSLSEVFFKELGLRKPDYVLSEKQETLGGQMAIMFQRIEEILKAENPDKVLLLGDTNSALSAILAERMGIPVVHMEAGNRCYDLNVPEEKNRRVIDAISSYNMPYTRQSKDHLVREGFPSHRIIQTGNPIYEVLLHYREQIEASAVLKTLELASGQYLLATVHRAENVDREEPLREIMEGLNRIAKTTALRMILSVHPRTRSRLEAVNGLKLHPLVEFHEPFGFFDFVKLEQHAACVLTDSGTVQEECCIFRVPTVTMRNSTERPETVDCGSNVVSGVEADRIESAARVMMAASAEWDCPQGYLDRDVSSKVVKFLLGGKGYVS